MIQREVTMNRGWVERANQFVREVKETNLPNGMRGFIKIKTIWDKYRIEPNGTSSNPGYICVIRQGNFVRFGFSRRPKKKILKAHSKGSSQELVWYGYTNNMLATKMEALGYFDDYKAVGEWLRITPHIAITYLKRITD